MHPISPRELLQERTKVTALSEELENPMNVHRWRKLEGEQKRRGEEREVNKAQCSVVYCSEGKRGEA